MIFRIFFSPFPRYAGQADERGKTKSADAEVFLILQQYHRTRWLSFPAESGIVISRFRLETEKAIDLINPVNPVNPV